MNSKLESFVSLLNKQFANLNQEMKLKITYHYAMTNKIKLVEITLQKEFINF